MFKGRMPRFLSRKGIPSQEQCWVIAVESHLFPDLVEFECKRKTNKFLAIPHICFGTFKFLFCADGRIEWRNTGWEHEVFNTSPFEGEVFSSLSLVFSLSFFLSLFAF